MSNQDLDNANIDDATASPNNPNIYNVDRFIEKVEDYPSLNVIRKQIEYYFSEENLVNDIFLREKMDEDGFIPISLITSFGKIKELTRDRDKIFLAMDTSYKLDVKNNKVRTLKDPTRWPIPYKEVPIYGDDDALNFHPLGQPKMTTKEIDISPTKYDNILPKSDIPYPTEQFFVVKESSNLSNPDETANGMFAQASTSKLLTDAHEQDSSIQEDSSEPQKATSNEVEPFPLELYPKLYKRAILERNHVKPERYNQMIKLYIHWTYHLRTSFNKVDYETFKVFALDDNSKGYRYGMECLFRFYSYGLEKVFDEDLFQDFQTLTIKDFKEGHLYGLEKFWAFMHYNKRQESPNDELREILSGYTCIEDFKVKKKCVSQLNPEAPEFVPEQHYPDHHTPGSLD